MRHQGKITFILTLMLISLISVGFSSWKLSDEGEVNGVFRADDVVNTTDYVAFVNSTIDEDFVFSEDGFVVPNPDYTPETYDREENPPSPYKTQYSVSFSVIYNLNFTQLNTDFKKNNITLKQANIIFTLKYKDDDGSKINVFNGSKVYISGLNVSFKQGNANNRYSQTKLDKAYDDGVEGDRFESVLFGFSSKTEGQFGNKLENDSTTTGGNLVITFNFALRNNSDKTAAAFKTNIYPYLSGINFEMQTELTVIY